MSFTTSQGSELEKKIQHALQNMHEPCTISELCNSCKTFCRQKDKVEKILQDMSSCDIIERHEGTFMLKCNVTEQIRHEWIRKIAEENARKAGSIKREPTSYADAVKRRASAPKGITSQHYDKPYKKSVSEITPSTSTNMGACGDNKRMVLDKIGKQLFEYDSREEVVAATIQNNTYITHNYTIYVNNCDLSRDKSNHFRLGDDANVQQ